MAEPAPLFFDPARYEQQMAASAHVRRGLIALVVAGWLLSIFTPLAATYWPALLLLAGLIGWLIANHVSSTTARYAMQTAQLAGEGRLGELEHALAASINRFTLYRTIRLMLYHHLAMLRQQQKRYDEAAYICHTLLFGDDGDARSSLRTRLLLLLADASLHRNDLASAHTALHELSLSRLDLGELLQTVALQVRYEAACGMHGQSVASLARKVVLAELMPPHAGAQTHTLLGAAALAQGFEHTGNWLRERAQLLGADLDAPATGFDSESMHFSGLAVSH